MNKAQSLKFLTDLGIDKSRAEKMVRGIPDTAETTPDDEMEEALTSAVSHQRELYTTSQDYKDAMKKLRDGAMGESRTKAQKKIIDIAKLTPEEVKDKSFDEIVDLAAIKMAKNGNKSVEDLQLEVQKLNEELRKANEEIIPGIQKQVDEEKETFKNDLSLIKSITGMKIRKGVDNEELIDWVKLKAKKAGYKIGRNEKGEAIFTDADGNKLQNADKKAFLTTNEILTSFLDGMIEKSNAREDEEEEEEEETEGGDNKRKAVIPGKKTETPKQGSAINAARQKALDHANKFKEAAKKK